MAKYLFLGNASYENRGCEAIVRGTVEILGHYDADPLFVSRNLSTKLPTFIPSEDDKRIQHKPLFAGRYSQPWFIKQISRLFKQSWRWVPGLRKDIQNADVVLALGGDNYSLDYGALPLHLALLDTVIARSKPFIIWGASVGPFDKHGDQYRDMVLERLSHATAIFVRESLSKAYLTQHGLGKIVEQVVDPAFVMEPKPVPGLEIKENAIGLNFSPLIIRYMHGDVNMATSMIRDTINSIQENWNIPVYLVPHVFQSHFNDYEFLSSVYGLLDNENVYMLPADFDAAQFKWIMSQFALFVGARTHSTIAALSSGIPTLSLGYSIKARGINQDIFGDERYVLNVKDISSERIVAKIGLMLGELSQIRNHLEDFLPAYKKTAFRAGEYLKTYLV